MHSSSRRILMHLEPQYTGCSLKIVFFPKILECLPLPRQQSAAIGCRKNYQQMGVVTVHSHCVRALKVSYSDVSEGWVAVSCEKT